MRTRLGILPVLAAVLAAGCSRSSPDDQLAARFGVRRDQVEILRNRKSLSRRAIQEMDRREFDAALREAGPPDLPQRRAAFRNLELRLANRPVPLSVVIESFRALQTVRMRGQARGMPGAAGAPSAMFNLTLPPVAHPGAPGRSGWVALGPTNIGGRTRAILIDPKNPDIVWLGSVGGGVWRSDPATMTFAPVDDFMANLSICCMVMDPRDSSTVYAGTGEGFYNGDAIRGAGIFRFSPATGKWTLLPGSDRAEMQYLTRLAISSDGRVLLASGSRREGDSLLGAIFRSEDANHTQWTQVSANNTADVKFHPTDPLQAVAGGAAATGQAWWSNDGGKTWQPAATPEGSMGTGRVELAYAAKNPSIVFALVDAEGGQVWKSTDGGRSYRAVATTPTDTSILGRQGWYDLAIWAGDPDDENFLLLGGINLWRSFDGGRTLSTISDWDNPLSVHADQHVIVGHPGYRVNKTVYIGNDGGVYKAVDATRAGSDDRQRVGWAHLNDTYATTQFFGIGVSPLTGTIIGGAQDNGTVQLVKGSAPCGWRVMSAGDGGQCIAHPGDRNVYYAEYINLDLIRSRDGGYTAEDISGIAYWDANGQPVCKARDYTLPDACSSAANFIAPIALDLRNPKRLFAGGQSLWLTANADAPVTDSTGPTWKAVKGPLALPPGSKPSDGYISAVAVSPSDSSVVWVGHNNGRIFRTRNAGAAEPDWEEIGPKIGAARMCTRIVFDPSDPRVTYLTFGGFETDNLWKTSTDGESWAPLWGGAASPLPRVPVFDLTMHPRNPQILYMATELGLLWSSNGGRDWSGRNEGPANCSVQALAWFGQTLIAATHGRGVFQIDLKLP